jgi:hypothetical protein
MIEQANMDDVDRVANYAYDKVGDGFLAMILLARALLRLSITVAELVQAHGETDTAHEIVASAMRQAFEMEQTTLH